MLANTSANSPRIPSTLKGLDLRTFFRLHPPNRATHERLAMRSLRLEIYGCGVVVAQCPIVLRRTIGPMHVHHPNSSSRSLRLACVPLFPCALRPTWTANDVRNRAICEPRNLTGIMAVFGRLIEDRGNYFPELSRPSACSFHQLLLDVTNCHPPPGTRRPIQPGSLG